MEAVLELLRIAEGEGNSARGRNQERGIRDFENLEGVVCED